MRWAGLGERRLARINTEEQAGNVAKEAADVGAIDARPLPEPKAAGVNADVVLLDLPLDPGGAATGSGRRDCGGDIAGAMRAKWLNRAGLLSIPGIGPPQTELLEAAGVDTVKKLARRNIANLTALLAETNARLGHGAESPARSQVKCWILQAKETATQRIHQNVQPSYKLKPS